MSDIKTIISNKVESLIKKSGLPIEQILFGAYIFFRCVNNQKFLEQIKTTYQTTKIDNYFRWLLDSIVFIGDFFFHNILSNPIIYILTIVISIIYNKIKKHFIISDKVNSFIYTITKIIIKTLILLISKMWIYYIIAKELVNEKPITYTFIDYLIIAINIIILFIIIKSSLSSRFGNPLILEKKKEENLISFARSDFENTTLYIPQNIYDIGNGNKLYYCVDSYTYKGICFKLLFDDKTENSKDKYNVLILLKSSDLSVVEKYYNFLVGKYEEKKE